MVAIQVLAEPEPWLEPSVDDEDVIVVVPRQRVRPLPDRATRIRRRRLAVLIVGVVVLAAVGTLTKFIVSAGTARAVGETPASPITESVYVVQPGDTLWTIAQRVAPNEDPRPVVDELRELNEGVELEVGTRLAVGDL